MLTVQIILIFLCLLVVAKTLSGRGTYAIKAWKKIALILLAMVMIFAILTPDSVTWVANQIGVGRGADLLIYIMLATFLFYVLGQYVRAQDDQDRLYRLARQVAIIDAKNRYNIK